MSGEGWIEDVIDRVGEVGVGALIALETVVPPIPSEVVLPLAGFHAAQGRLDPIGTWVAATIGALAGALLLYGLGAVLGYDRLHALAGHRWFFIVSQRDLERGHRFFDRHGTIIVLIGRCIPLVRSVVSIPAGVTGMPLWRFLTFSAIGTGVWNALFIFAGWQLEERWDRVEQWIEPASYVVLAVLVVGLVYLIVRRVRVNARADEPASPT